MTHPQLKRQIRTPGAILMGLGSILGTGIFVSIAIATQVAGSGIVVAILVAALLAATNGLSSAQLAAAHPVSGGTYAYGYRFLGSYLGFTAGWMFLVAKSASAATAVLGCIGYLFHILPATRGADGWVTTAAALLLLGAMTFLVAGGIERSNRANQVIVLFTLVGLGALVAVGWAEQGAPLTPATDALSDTSLHAILYASALMFVAYTGYGRIATLGEEVVDPRRTIPRAIVLSMVVIVLLYLAVTLTALETLGAEAFGGTLESGEGAPLMAVAQALGTPWIGRLVTAAAITAMLGVLLNLLLGLSRVVLGMARQRDLPAGLAEIHPTTESPRRAVWATGVLIAVLVLRGDVVFTWSFSAFTVLLYYAITNLAALRLPADLRLYPRVIPMLGLGGCLFLAAFVDREIWILGLVVVLAGVAWHAVARRLRG
jgi:basic amino acid/polyamine antiporter, APA family